MSQVYKLRYNNEIRKISGISSYENLLAQVAIIYKFELTKVQFKYTDEDGDQVSISSQEDFDVFNSYVVSQGQTVKIDVYYTGGPAENVV